MPSPITESWHAVIQKVNITILQESPKNQKPQFEEY